MKTWIPIASLEVDIPQRTIRYWCETKRVRARKIGKKWFVHLPSMLSENGFSALAEEIVSGNIGKPSDRTS